MPNILIRFLAAVNALYAMHGWAIDAVDEIECNNNYISREKLQLTTLELCHILKYEFILCPVSADQIDTRSFVTVVVREKIVLTRVSLSHCSRVST